MSKIHDILSNKGDKLWHVRIPDGSLFGPADEPTLREWAKAGNIQPDHDVSSDQKFWARADTLPSLASYWEASRKGATLSPAVASVDLSADASQLHEQLGKTQAERAADKQSLSKQERALQKAVDTTTKELETRNAELKAARDEAMQIERDAKTAEKELLTRISELETQVAPGNIADASRDAVAQLQQTRDELKATRQELRNAEKQNEKSASKLKDQQAELKKSANAAERERNKQEKALARLESEKTELLATKESTEAELKKHIASLSKKVPAADDVKQSKSTVDELRAAHEQLSTAREELNTFKAEKRQELATLQKREKELARQATADEKQLAKTEQALEELKADHTELRDINKKTLAQLRAKVDKLRDRNPTAAELRESQETVAEFKDARESLAEARSALTELRRELRESTAEYKREHKALEKATLTHAAELESSEEVLEEMDEAIDEHKSSAARTQKPLEKRVATLADRCATKPAKDASAAIHNKFEKTKADLADVREKLKAEKSSARDTYSELKVERDELAQAVRDDASLVSESKKAQKELDRAHKALAHDLRKQEKALERDIARLDRDAPSTAEMKNSKAALARQEKTKADLAEARDLLKEQTAQSKQTVGELQASLDELKSTAAQREQELEKERAAIQTLREKYNRHKEAATKTESDLKHTVDGLRADAPTASTLRSKEQSIAKLEASQTELAESHAKLAALESTTAARLFVLEEKRVEAEANATSAAAQRDTERHALEALKAEHATLKSDSSSREKALHQQVAVLEEKIADAPDARKARAAVNKIEKLEDELHSAKEALDTLTLESAEQISELTQKEDALIAGTQDANDSLKSDTESLRRLQKRYHALERRSERLESKLRDQITHLEENAASSSEMLESAFEAMQDHSTLGNTDSPLNVTLLPHNDEEPLSVLKEKLEVAEEKAAYIETQLGLKRDEHNTHVATLSAEIKALATTADALAEENSEEKSERKKVDAQKKELEARLASAEAERVRALKAAREDAQTLKTEYQSLIEEVKDNEARLRKRMEEAHSEATRETTQKLEAQIHTLRTQLGSSEEQLLSLNDAVQEERRQRLRTAKLSSDAHGAFSEQFEKVRVQAENAATIIEANQRTMGTRNAELENQLTALSDRMLSLQTTHQEEQVSLEETLSKQKAYYENRLQRSIDRQEQLMKILENMQSAMVQA